MAPAKCTSGMHLEWDKPRCSRARDDSSIRHIDRRQSEFSSPCLCPSASPPVMCIIVAWHPVVSPCFLAAPLTHPPLPETLLLLSRLVIDHRHHHHCPLHFLLLILVASPLPLPLFNLSISSSRRCPTAAAAAAAARTSPACIAHDHRLSGNAQA